MPATTARHQDPARKLQRTSFALSLAAPVALGPPQSSSGSTRRCATIPSWDAVRHHKDRARPGRAAAPIPNRGSGERTRQRERVFGRKRERVRDRKPCLNLLSPATMVLCLSGVRLPYVCVDHPDTHMCVWVKASLDFPRTVLPLVASSWVVHVKTNPGRGVSCRQVSHLCSVLTVAPRSPGLGRVRARRKQRAAATRAPCAAALAPQAMARVRATAARAARAAAARTPAVAPTVRATVTARGRRQRPPQHQGAKQRPRVNPPCLPKASGGCQTRSLPLA